MSPCNLAVTIQKAAVLPSHLLALLTPEAVEKVVTAYLSSHAEYKNYQPLRSRISGESVIFHLGSLSYRVTITGGCVALNFPRYNQDKAATLSEELTQLLAQAADVLFAQQVKSTLTKKFGRVKQTTATVKDAAEEPQKVTVFTLDIQV